MCCLLVGYGGCESHDCENAGAIPRRHLEVVIDCIVIGQLTAWGRKLTG